MKQKENRKINGERGKEKECGRQARFLNREATAMERGVGSDANHIIIYP
jgi:hypothetical protein